MDICIHLLTLDASKSEFKVAELRHIKLLRQAGTKPNHTERKQMEIDEHRKCEKIKGVCIVLPLLCRLKIFIQPLQAAVYWQTYDAFARVSMSVGINQLMLGMSYYILGFEPESSNLPCSRKWDKAMPEVPELILVSTIS